MNRRDFVATTAALVGSTTWASQAPEVKATVVLFQGDSITDCGRNRTSAEPNSAGALGTGYPLLVASAVLAARASQELRFYNRGISGNKVPDLQQRWTTDAIDLQPDVLSILIGVNDFWHKLSGGYTGTVQDYEQQYAALLADTRRALPRVHLIVLEPFVLRVGAVDQRWFPEFDMRRAAAARVAKQARATFVPLQAVFDQRVRTRPPDYWAADGVHPTPAGHAVIAEHWRKAAHL
ncbi:MAG TPA: GDSL-type esterase/lipase family protein [Gemmatimonadales bacterium]|nr:GDSL-type esterase/lipase family protein [Gemmatimonadales bacterium]